MSGASDPGEQKILVVRGKDNPVGFGHVRRGMDKPHVNWAVESGRVVLDATLLSQKLSAKLRVPGGSLMMVRGESVDEVKEFIEEDPLKKGGVFEVVKVTGWKQVFTFEFFKDDLFVLYCLDKEGMMETRAKTRPAHLAWWNASGREGIVGPLLSEDGAPIGSLLIFEQDGSTVPKIQEWAETDPYNQAGVFASVEVYAARRCIADGKPTQNP